MNEHLKEEYPQYRSDEEVYFQWYIDDLIEEGFIDKWNYEEEVYTIFDSLKLPWEEQMKTQVSSRKFGAIQKSTYRPDFNLYWEDKAKGIFISGIPSIQKPAFAGSEFLDLTDQGKSTIDVKGAGGSKAAKKNTSVITFPLKQRLMWIRNNIFVHKVVPQELFEKTFTPYRYIFTNQSGAKRKIKWKVRTVSEYAKMMKDGHKVREESGQSSLF